jgi:hypothetical protein
MHHYLRCLSLLLVLCWGLFLADPTHAQSAPTYRWVSVGGGPGYDMGDWVVPDAAGNVYMVGNFEKIVTLGSATLTTRGASDIFLAKYDPQGQLLWVHSVGGPGEDGPGGLAVDAAGNAYIAGAFSAAVTSTGTPHPTMQMGSFLLNGGTGYAEMFVAKFDPQGNVQWAHNTVGTAISGANQLTLDRNGNVYVIGQTDKQYPAFSANTSNGTYVAKYNAQGMLRWVKTGFGYSYGDYEQLAVDASEQLYVVSYDQQFPLVGPAFSETRLSKLDANGQLLWQKVLQKIFLSPSSSVTRAI